MKGNARKGNFMPSQTVFVTGASGFIAKHILIKLLNAGYNVRGSVRSLDRADEIRAAVSPHLADTKGLNDRLTFVALDLTHDDGWNTALKGADALMHTASPFPLSQPKDENDLIRPAVDGTLRALRAAKTAGIKRVILTSSFAAVGYREPDPAKPVFDEDDWSDLNHPTATAYTKSKTLAERAAWDYVASDVPEMALTTINPVGVFGPPLDGHFGSSVAIIQRVLSGKDPMVPRLAFGVVDVRDVAEMHLRALQQPETAGKRFLAVDRFLWFKDMAETLAADYPDRKIARRVAPDILIRLLGLFDSTIRSILPSLGRYDQVSNARAQTQMGMTFIPATDSIRATAKYLVDNRLV